MIYIDGGRLKERIDSRDSEIYKKIDHKKSIAEGLPTMNKQIFIIIAFLLLFVGCRSTPTDIGKERTYKELAINDKIIFSNMKQLHLLSMVYHQKFNKFPRTVTDLKKLKPSFIEDMDLDTLSMSYNIMPLISDKITVPDITPFIIYNSSDKSQLWITYIDGHVVAYRTLTQPSMRKDLIVEPVSEK